MKPFELILAFFIATLFQSCSTEAPLPTSGENSFTTKINGNQFIAEDVRKFATTDYGITAAVFDNTWRLIFSNSSDRNIYIYIYEVNDTGEYLVGKADGDLVYYLESDDETSVSISDGTGSTTGVAFSSTSELTEYISITNLQDDSIIVGEFDKITLTDPDNANNNVILSDGKFNINRNTLNQNEL